MNNLEIANDFNKVGKKSPRKKTSKKENQVKVPYYLLRDKNLMTAMSGGTRSALAVKK